MEGPGRFDFGEFEGLLTDDPDQRLIIVDALRRIMMTDETEDCAEWLWKFFDCLDIFSKREVGEAASPEE